ncbi:MAG: hypothetical protein QOH13_442 [Thermoleophilaceae bacterium]|nr:hypothetical protein [Thermoleophilaceae bacterium]
MRSAPFRRFARVFALAAVTAALAVPASAGAASVAYVDNGEVWLSSLDGTQKARLAMPVVNSDGDTETWLDVAHSDNGRIVAVRNKPGRMSSFSWFKVWEPDGSSTVEGPLNAPSGWAVYAYPLGFDITADGSTLVYGYTNSSACCPTTLGRGTYVRPATNSVLAPIDLGIPTHPSLLGNRIVGLENSSNPKVVQVQNAAAGNPFNDEFTPWLDLSGPGLDANRVDIAATGQLAAFGFETYSGGTQTVGKISLLSIQGVDAMPTFPATVDCFVPAAGVALDGSLSQDAATIAWKDEGGLKVAGTPTTSADPCAMSSAPVVLSATGQHPAIGGADVTRFLPPPTSTEAPPTSPGSSAPPSGTPSGTPPPAPAGSGAKPFAPILTLPAKLTAKALASARGVAVKVKVSGPGKIAITGRVPAKRMGRRGKPAVAATGQATARAAGTVTVRVRFNAAARKRARTLKGTRLSLRVVHGGLSSAKSITLR